MPPFDPPRRIELEFSRAIQKLLERKLHIPTGSTVGEILDLISQVVRDETAFEELGILLSRRMVTQVRTVNARSWREAARKAGRGREIYNALQEELRGPVGFRLQDLIRENSELIGSIPAALRESINREIAGLEQEGYRPRTIAEHIRRRVPQLAHSKAELIARTETAKAVTALTQARSEDLGIGWYQWQTSQDQRVRASHRLMNKVLVRWSDPPSPEHLAHIESTLGNYPAGGAPNCRCVALPLIDLREITWPAKVYHSGRIERMTRARFVKFSGLSKAA